MTGAPDASIFRVDKLRVLAEVATMAKSRGLRVLASGGPVFASNGLISPRVTGVALVIADPKGVRELVQLLLRSGWLRKPAKGGLLLPAVSSRLIHPAHACELDIHFVFPGFHRNPQSAFDLLWERRREVAMCGVGVQSLDRVSLGLIAAAEKLQHRPGGDPADFDYLMAQFLTVLSKGEQEDLVRMVTRLGAAGEMQSLLARFGVEMTWNLLPSQTYALWRLSLEKVDVPTLACLAVLECPPRQRLRAFARFVSRQPGMAAKAVLGAPWGLFVVAGTRRRRRRVEREGEWLFQMPPIEAADAPPLVRPPGI